jgi:DNA-binding CsgD family transcriptional regulator
VYELATEFSIDRKTISRHLKAAGVQMRLRPLNTDQVREAIRLYDSGLSLAAIGLKLGVHSSTVRFAIREQGVSMRKPWDHPRQRGIPS